MNFIDSIFEASNEVYKENKEFKNEILQYFYGKNYLKKKQDLLDFVNQKIKENVKEEFAKVTYRENNNFCFKNKQNRFSSIAEAEKSIFELINSFPFNAQQNLAIAFKDYKNSGLEDLEILYAELLELKNNGSDEAK